MIKAKTKNEIFILAKEHSIFKQFIPSNCNKFLDIPITSKDNLFDILPTCNRNIYENSYISFSGATGGKSIAFPSNIEENKEFRKLFVKHLKEEEIMNENEIYLNLFFHGCYRSLSLFDDFINITGATSFSLGDNISNSKILEYIQKYKITSICSSSRKLTDFALYIKHLGITNIYLNSILFAAEPLQTSKMLLLRDVFHTNKIIGIYGSCESGVWAHQYIKDSIEGNNKYICYKDMVYLEINNPNNESIGDILITNLIRTSKIPIIRYKMGDQGRILQSDNHKIYFELIGRASKDFSFANSFVTLQLIEECLTSNILEWQVIVNIDNISLKDILLLRVSGENIDKDLLYKTLYSKVITIDDIIIHAMLIKIEICNMNEFILSRVGKIIRIIDKRE